jgi:hypothetical protein
MFNCNIHVIFLSRGVILTTNHFFQVNQDVSLPEQQPTPPAGEEHPRGRTTRSNSATPNKGANSAVVYTTTKQLKETAARKEHPKRMHRYYAKPFNSLCIDKEHVLLSEKVHICLLNVNEFYFYNFCLTNACQ